MPRRIVRVDDHRAVLVFQAIFQRALIDRPKLLYGGIPSASSPSDMALKTAVSLGQYVTIAPRLAKLVARPPPLAASYVA
jgi:hypothetical protein